MKIEQLEEKSKIDVLVGVLVHLDNPENLDNGKVLQTGIMEDDTGQVKIKLWEDYSGKFEKGQKVSINNGYCGSFEGELFVTSGKFGKINKVDTAPIQG